MYKLFKYFAAFSVSSYSNAFVCSARLFCTQSMLGYFYTAIFVFVVSGLLTHGLLTSMVVLHHV